MRSSIAQVGAMSCSILSSAAGPPSLRPNGSADDAFGIEIDPAYVDALIRRWQAFTGGVARHAVTGEVFDGVPEEARYV